MNVPIQTQVLDIIELRLRNMTLLNGYFSELAKIERARLKPFNNGDMPAVNYYYTGDILDQVLMNGVSERGMSVIIEYYDSTRDQVFTDLSSKLSADVLIALERSPDAPGVTDEISNRLGQVVMRYEVDSITPAIGSGQTPYCGAVVVLNIFYRVNKQNPFIIVD